MTTRVLQPPTVAKGDRHLEAVTARLAGVAVTFPVVWDPQTCPLSLLPWLAWGLSIDVWDPSWDEPVKRQMVAEAIERQRRKGTVRAVREVLEPFDVGLTLHEWFEADLLYPPYTFEVRLPVDGGETVLASFVEKVFDHIVRVKPVRAHFSLAQTLEVEGALGVIATARGALSRRLGFEEAAEVDWTGCLLTEDGEPLFTEDGIRLEEESA